ncbi:putative clathrin assembly protein [Cinnamomum micranthum f. kanehirae]|uniref:Putative clathrin assembly protein n=1 Tax=Cinnamomum micranthum f. kanehirae TaxID=337451 RepID=A0A443PLA3_9MAGN|nr:putative clathrin assembly protein [Cinnamomum micranthum f. kanehirae]
MGTLQSLKKAYGALKDSTTVGLAKVNSEFKELDIAIVKATNHSQTPPKERYVRKIFTATSVVCPRADVAYCIQALAKRLGKTRSWMVALKTLIVIHRTLREGDPTFREELINYSRRAHILRISSFKDDSSILAWDCSSWAERLKKSAPGATKGHSRTSELGSHDLLEQLPSLQQLLFRLIGCRPEGASFYNDLIQYALTLVLKESFKLYCAINDGIINLVDLFYDMSRYDALKAFNIYKRAGQQAEGLTEFYEFCKGLDLARNFQFPTLRQPPPSFLATMEEYIKEAPRTGAVSNKRLEYKERDVVTCKSESSLAEDLPIKKVDTSHIMPAAETEEPPPPTIEAAPQSAPTENTGDLLGLNEVNPVAVNLDESTAMALVIVPPEDDSKPLSTRGLEGIDMGVAGWELELVTAPSSNTSHLTENRLGGGFNKLLLDSLYENGEAMQQQQQQQNTGYGFGMTINQFDPHDPFFISNGIAPPSNMQMALMAQQQQLHQQQNQHQQHMMSMMMVPYSSQRPQHQQQQQMGSTNPFGDPFEGFSSSAPQQVNQSLL